MAKRKAVIMGAAGRDFHNFNCLFRDDPNVEVVAFTATQIPGIEGRRYPPTLAGRLYPKGIPILPEEDLDSIIRKRHIDLVVFSYSDVSHEAVMHLASRVMAAGADFRLMGPASTTLLSSVPLDGTASIPGTIYSPGTGSTITGIQDGFASDFTADPDSWNIGTWDGYDTASGSVASGGCRRRG